MASRCHIGWVWDVERSPLTRDTGNRYVAWVVRVWACGSEESDAVRGRCSIECAKRSYIRNELKWGTNTNEQPNRRAVGFE